MGGMLVQSSVQAMVRQQAANTVTLVVKRDHVKHRIHPYRMAPGGISQPVEREGKARGRNQVTRTHTQPASDQGLSQRPRCTRHQCTGTTQTGQCPVDAISPLNSPALRRSTAGTLHLHLDPLSLPLSSLHLPSPPASTCSPALLPSHLPPSRPRTAANRPPPSPRWPRVHPSPPSHPRRLSAQTSSLTRALLLPLLPLLLPLLLLLPQQFPAPHVCAQWAVAGASPAAQGCSGGIWRPPCWAVPLGHAAGHPSLCLGALLCAEQRPPSLLLHRPLIARALTSVCLRLS